MFVSDTQPDLHIVAKSLEERLHASYIVVNSAVNCQLADCIIDFQFIKAMSCHNIYSIRKRIFTNALLILQNNVSYNSW